MATNQYAEYTRELSAEQLDAADWAEEQRQERAFQAERCNDGEDIELPRGTAYAGVSFASVQVIRAGIPSFDARAQAPPIAAPVAAPRKARKQKATPIENVCHEETNTTPTAAATQAKAHARTPATAETPTASEAAEVEAAFKAAIAQLVEQYGCGAVIDAAWQASHAQFQPGRRRT